MYRTAAGLADAGAVMVRHISANVIFGQSGIWLDVVTRIFTCEMTMFTVTCAATT